jgi:hypothetical protein
MMKAAAAQRCNLRTQNDSVPLNVNTMATWQRLIATSLRQLRPAIEPVLDAIRLGGVDLPDVATGPSSLPAERRRRNRQFRLHGKWPHAWSESGSSEAKQKATRSDNSRYRDAKLGLRRYRFQSYSWAMIEGGIESWAR